MHALFPPRYAGMEGSGTKEGQGYRRFPRATRGWKEHAPRVPKKATVSPALRGDGRHAIPADPRQERFPPRYAGMEAFAAPVSQLVPCFPRASLGW